MQVAGNLRSRKTLQGSPVQETRDRNSSSWCPICLESTDDPSANSLECTGCRLRVHKGCVISPAQTGSREWTCEPCRAQDLDARCIYCPVKTGLLKPTKVADSIRWVHPLCIKLIDDCGRCDKSEAVSNTENQLSTAKCDICESAGAARVKCSVTGCDREFHVGCMLLQRDASAQVRRHAIGFRTDASNKWALRTLFCDVHSATDYLGLSFQESSRDYQCQATGVCANCGKAEGPGKRKGGNYKILCKNRAGRCDKWFHADCSIEYADDPEWSQHRLCKECVSLTSKFSPQMLVGTAAVTCSTCSAQFSSLHALDVHISSNPKCFADAQKREVRVEDPSVVDLTRESQGDQDVGGRARAGPESDSGSTESEKAEAESRNRTKAKPKLLGGVGKAATGNAFAQPHRNNDLSASQLKRKHSDENGIGANGRGPRPKEGRDQLRDHAATCSLLDLGDADVEGDAGPAESNKVQSSAGGEDGRRSINRPAALDSVDPEKQNQGLGALKWCAGGAGGGGRWIVDGTNASSPTDKKTRFDQLPLGKSSKDPTMIGDGIMISGGRVLMQSGSTEISGGALCSFCQRTFISAHALDVHLSRNQVCRFENEQAKARKKNNPGGMQHPVKQYMERRPQTALKGGFAGMASHGESCRDVMLAFMRVPDMARFKVTAVGNDDPNLGLASVNKKATATQYKNANDMRDDVLAIWAVCHRFHPRPGFDAQALSKEFDRLFENAMDKVRGMGGMADNNFFRHGSAWVGQKVKVYVPADHARIPGVIDEYDEVDSTTHLYHIQYDDGNHQWTTLPNPKVELVGWIPDEEVKNPLATYVANASNIPALKATPTTTKQGPSAILGSEAVSRVSSDKTPVGQEASSVLKTPLQDPPSRSDSVHAIHCPSFKEGQDVQMLLRGKGKYLLGQVVSPVGPGMLDIRTQDGELHKAVPDDFVRAPEGPINHVEIAQLVQELKRKPQYDFFDHPVDDQYVANYYHPNPAARQRGITAWNTQSMCFAWMEKKASKKQYPNVSEVEYDFNLIISNAVIFNPQQHPVNREARRLFQAAKTVFSKWSRKPGSYSCKTCNKDDTFHEPIVICDFCCRGIHQQCFLQLGGRSVWLWSQEVSHPFRGDSAFFCSESCLKQFQCLTDSFKMPTTSVAPQESVSKRMRIDVEGAKEAAPAGSGMPLPALSRPLGSSRQNAQLPSPGTIGGFTLKVLPQAAQSLQLPLSTKAKTLTAGQPPEHSIAGVPGTEKTGSQTPTKAGGGPQAKSQAEIRDMKNSLMAIRAARDAEKACQQRYQTAQLQLQEALSSQSVNSALFDEAQRTCLQFQKAVAAGSGSKERFLSQSGGSGTGAGQQSNLKAGHLRETSATVSQLYSAWSVEQKALGRCQDTQKALQDVLQGTDDPPDELLEAAEQACEEYDRAMSITASLRDKYLAFTTVS